MLAVKRTRKYFLSPCLPHPDHSTDDCLGILHGFGRVVRIRREQGDHILPDLNILNGCSFIFLYSPDRPFGYLLPLRPYLQVDADNCPVPDYGKHAVPPDECADQVFSASPFQVVTVNEGDVDYLLGRDCLRIPCGDHQLEDRHGRESDSLSFGRRGDKIWWVVEYKGGINHHYSEHMY